MKKSILLTMFCALVLIWSFGCDSESELKNSPPNYPNAGLLISGNSLENSLGASNQVVIDARSNTDYLAGHIPGAINLIHGDYWTWGEGLNTPSILETKLGEKGLTRNMKIIVYDNTTDSWGAAGRIFWMLEYLGCSDVHILNGGWDKWVADAKDTETTVNTLTATTFAAKLKSDVRSTKESILYRLGDDDFAVIDARTDEEYNGWQIYGEARGGHIPGAVQIPYKWFYNDDKTVLSYSDLKELFESRGITRDKEVTANCTVGIRSGFVYFALRLMGYTQASNYDASIVEWADADETTYGMDKLKYYHKLVYADWVKALVAGGNPGTSGNPETYLGNGYVIVEVQSSSPYYGSTSDYDNGHIPGAIHTGPDDLEAGINDSENPGVYFYPHYRYPADGALLPDADYIAKVESWGITRDTTVIVYGTKTGSSVFRVAWMLMYAGVEDVRVLNGGYAAWTEAGGEVELTENNPSTVAFGADAPVHPEYLATADDVDTLRQQSKDVGIVADIRRWEEFIGELNPYTSKFDLCTFETKGHIPGGVWAYNSTELVDGSSVTLRSYTEVEKMWADLGITADKKIIFHCGTGWRSSQAFFYAYLMGFSDVSNYNGSWFEWSWPEDDRPIATGNQ